MYCKTYQKKNSLYVLQTKELCIFRKRALYICKKSPICIAKHTKNKRSPTGIADDLLYLLQNTQKIPYTYCKRGGKNLLIDLSSLVAARENEFRCSLPPIHVWHDSFIFDVWHDLFMGVFAVCWLSLVAVREKLFWYSLPPIRVWHDSFISDVWHDSFICVAWLIHMCDVFYLSMAAAREKVFWYLVSSYLCVTWLVYMCGITLS